MRSAARNSRTPSSTCAPITAALVLRHMEGLSYAEIAEVLQVPNGTAKGWVSRGRAAMLVMLAEKDGLHRKEEAGE